MPRGKIYRQPTTQLKLNVPEPLHAALMRFSKLSGVPASRFVTLLLMQNLDTFKQLGDVLEAAAQPEVSVDDIAAQLGAMLNQGFDELVAAREYVPRLVSGKGVADEPARPV